MKPKPKPVPAPLDLPDQTPAELAQLKESIEKYGILSAVIRSTTGKTIQGRAVEKIADELGIPRSRVPVITADIKESEVLAVRIRLELSGRDRSGLRSLLNQVLIQNPRMTSREIARIAPELGHRSTIDRARLRLVASGAIAPVDRIDKRGHVHPAAVMTTSLEAGKIGRKLQAIEDKPSGLISRRELQKLSTLEERDSLVKRAPKTTPKHIRIENCDFRDFPTPKADLVVCDPPWTRDWGGREDLARKAWDSLSDGGFLLAYTGHSMLAEFLDVYRSVGFTYRWTIACVWTDGPAIRPGNISTGFTPILLFSKGSGKLPRIVSDVVRDDPEPRFHDWAQSTYVLTELIAKLTNPGARIADFTLGSGTTAIATCRAGEGRSFSGCEIDEKHCAVARQRVADALRPFSSGKTPSFNFYGGKSRLRKWIVDRFPRSGRRYAEPFLGRGNVYFEARKRLDFSEWQIGDVDTAFFQALMRVDLDSLPESVSREDFERYRKSNCDVSKVIEPRVTFAGKGYRYGFDTTDTTHTPYRGDLYRTNCLEARRLIGAASLSACSWESWDWSSFGPEDFVYFDPPYEGTDCPYPNIDHAELIRTLNRARFRWAVSGYPSDLYEKTLRYKSRHEKYRQVAIQSYNDGRDSTVKDVLWTNYEE